MAIPDEILEQLRAAGLVAVRQLAETHATMPGCVRVAKPAGTPGNGLAECTRTWSLFGDVVVNTPVLAFFRRGETWWVRSKDYIPGPGPGDFCNEWPSAEEAVADLLAFFFGDPARMNAKSRDERHRATRDARTKA